MKNIPLASFTKRILATIIDYFVYFLFIYVYIMYFGEEINEGYQVTGVKALPIFLIWFIYFIVVEGIWQATLGHMVLNIKVCQENFDTIDIGHSFKRRILDFVDLTMFGLVAYIVAKNSATRQRVGDSFAKTLVVEDEYE